MRKSTAILLLLLSFSLLSCQRDGGQGERGQKDEGRTRGAETEKREVVASLFPLYDFARNVGGERAHVTLLLPPGTESHSFEPKPADIIALTRADIFIYTNKFMEPWVDDILKGVANKDLLVVNASSGLSLMEGSGEDGHDHDREHGHGHDPVDPHVWLDFSNAIRMVNTILEGFLQVDPAHGDIYRKNAEEYQAKLKALDEKFRSTLAGCGQKMFVSGGHSAFGYLARRYGLEYRAAYGFSPDAEPTPGELAEVARILKKNRLHYLFYEELLTPRVAEAIAAETGATLLKLHAAHNVSREEMERGVTFLSLMEENLESLRTGLQCR
ncbi:MAG: metal ABC transporter substrate-binding protein [Alphaproteobacteria bacterium]|uniref:Metal ABC transporter substrate-binding protein n=1 Tax=Candidatus Nitrobium versatile TaxID=2884831 RepID=A0A953SEJ4_9BACT|nr:metal ABC transporter substrate-binding protein [Candidatus Nitrobium versatile]